MTPAMQNHLRQQQHAAIAAEACAEALELLLSKGLGHHRAAHGLASVLIATLADLNVSLDSVNLSKVDAA